VQYTIVWSVVAPSEALGAAWTDDGLQPCVGMSLVRPVVPSLNPSANSKQVPAKCFSPYLKLSNIAAYRVTTHHPRLSTACDSSSPHLANM
jgi:hypothetical protein